MRRRKGRKERGRSSRGKSTTKDEELLYRKTPVYDILSEVDVQKILNATFQLMSEIGIENLLNIGLRQNIVDRGSSVQQFFIFRG